MIFGSLFGRRGDAAASAAAADSAPTDTALLEAVIAGMPDVAMVLDREGRLIAANPAARVIAPALVRGRRCRSPCGSRDRRCGAARRRRAASRAGSSSRSACRSTAGSPPMSRRSPGRSGAGLMLLVLHDLTPLRRIEEMRVDFVANASHELRTPLAALSGFIDTLLGPARDDPAARERFLAIMKTQATRMARLIDDLLSLSRVELNEHLHPDKPIDLVAVVRQVTDSLQTLAHDRNVDDRTQRRPPSR